jgi:DNA-binding NarL/FixJ family response regulator
MNQPRILVADDHPDVLRAIHSLLRDVGEVVGMVADGMALVQAAHRLAPDVIIADISMPGLSGLEATRALQRSMPGSKVIILTVHRSPLYASLAFDAGAYGYVLKSTAAAPGIASISPHRPVSSSMESRVDRRVRHPCRSDARSVLRRSRIRSA